MFQATLSWTSGGTHNSKTRCTRIVCDSQPAHSRLINTIKFLRGGGCSKYVCLITTILNLEEQFDVMESSWLRLPLRSYEQNKYITLHAGAGKPPCMIQGRNEGKLYCCLLSVDPGVFETFSTHPLPIWKCAKVAKDSFPGR